MWGGGGGCPEGFMSMLKKNYREDFVHVVKFIGEIMVDMSTYTNLSRGDFVWGGDIVLH